VGSPPIIKTIGIFLVAASAASVAGVRGRPAAGGGARSLRKESLTTEKTTNAAWRIKPSFYAVSTQDRTINPDLERFMAKRMGAKTIEINASHGADLTTRCDHEPDYGGTRRLRPRSNPGLGGPNHLIRRFATLSKPLGR
jgi:hypothetical protein